MDRLETKSFVLLLVVASTIAEEYMITLDKSDTLVRQPFVVILDILV